MIRYSVLFLLLIVCLSGANLSLSSFFQERSTRELQGVEDARKALRHFELRGDLALPTDSAKKRILYISNSHARTGGDVTRHLQGMLDHVAPDVFELVDLSAPGIFAPDMLLRALYGLNYKPELLLLPVAYISFSDRMQLRRQSITARSFFRKDLREKLPIRFFLRHWDIALYLDMLLSEKFALFQERNRVRDLWEQPLARNIKALSGDPRLRFLEVDERRSWAFPDGFDRNLFDWSLYRLGRESHLADIRDLVRITQEENLPLIAFNLPIDWEKEPRTLDKEDYALFQEELGDAFKEVSFVNYEKGFPKAFSTYDALHPTVHGARLHALDLFYRMQVHGFEELQGVSLLDLQAEAPFLSPEDYQAQISDLRGLTPPAGFRRFDLSDPHFAKELLVRLIYMPIGSVDEQQLLKDIAFRLRFWASISPYRAEEGFSSEWSKVLESEALQWRARREAFKRILRTLQSKRLASFPLPLRQGAKLVKSKVIQQSEKTEFEINELQYQGASGAPFVLLERSRDKKAFAIIVPPFEGKGGFTRIDLFGDGSFLYVQDIRAPLLFPDWARGAAVFKEWGV